MSGRPGASPGGGGELQEGRPTTQPGTRRWWLRNRTCLAQHSRMLASTIHGATRCAGDQNGASAGPPRKTPQQRTAVPVPSLLAVPTCIVPLSRARVSASPPIVRDDEGCRQLCVCVDGPGRQSARHICHGRAQRCRVQQGGQDDAGVRLRHASRLATQPQPLRVRSLNLRCLSRPRRRPSSKTGATVAWRAQRHCARTLAARDTPGAGTPVPSPGSHRSAVPVALTI